jgi:RimJ/RimL family protein N-acetyltransferase
VTNPVILRPLTSAELPVVRPWFADPDTRRFLGGPEWPARMLELGQRTVGQEFRGATQTGAVHYLATRAGQPVGYLDCGTFDRWAVYDATNPDAPIIRDTLDVPTGYLALCVDPARRGQGIGRAGIDALLRRPELAAVQRFAAGVEPANLACRRCLRGAGFHPFTPEPDFEDMLYYVRDRPSPPPSVEAQ